MRKEPVQESHKHRARATNTVQGPRTGFHGTRVTENGRKPRKVPPKRSIVLLSHEKKKRNMVQNSRYSGTAVRLVKIWQFYWGLRGVVRVPGGVPRSNSDTATVFCPRSAGLWPLPPGLALIFREFFLVNFLWESRAIEPVFWIA